MRINEKHKSIVENRNYIYIGTYDTNEIMLDSNKLRKPRTRYVRVKCKYCSDGISIPEKFVGNTLQRLNIKFETHKRFKWSDNKEYDFYIPSLNMIIETHGLQHYKRSFEKLSGRARTLEEEQANDKYKKELAITNGIENYIIVDCRYSKLDWLKENTIKELSLYFDLSNVIWGNIWKESQKSLVAKVLQMYENGMSVDEISDSIKLSKYTINEYLKYKK